MGMNGEFNFRGPNPVRIRCCQYLNNVVEQDHRRVKGRLRPMLLGFKTFYNARRVIIGIELAQKIHKRQFLQFRSHGGRIPNGEVIYFPPGGDSRSVCNLRSSPMSILRARATALWRNDRR